MMFAWDSAKSKKLKKLRGFSFDEVTEIFEHLHYEDVKNDNPIQFRVIGWVKGKLITLIYEECGGELHFVTYWKSTKTEEKLWQEKK